jgi:hypothetical protein
MRPSVRWGLGPWMLTALAGPCGCSTWTSIHAGYGLAPSTDRSVAGLEVRRAIGSSIHSSYGLVGARVDGKSSQFDAEAHVGAMRPLPLSESVTLAPSVTVELARLSNIDGRWLGGALGPGLGTELIWWFATDRHDYESGSLLGCMGGVEGVDCPTRCHVQDVTRHGIGIRVAAEYDMRLDSSYPRMNDWLLWLTVGVTRVVSDRETECCSNHLAPLPRPCTLVP